MNRVDLHPEQLFDRMRAGSLSREEFGLLKRHCTDCVTCRLELELALDPMAPAAPDAQDCALGMAVVDRMLRPSPAPAAVQRMRAPSKSAGFIAAGIVLGCSMTAAALVPRFPLAIAQAVAELVGLSHTRRAPSRTVAELPASHKSQIDERGASLAPLSPDVRTGVDSGPAVVAQAARRVTAPVGHNSPREGADALLASAARARARGDYEEAADYYRMLRRHYLNTEAEVVARVSLGRLLCSKLREPQEAIELFDGYLRERPGGALDQEARSGRAICLERLGRSQEARAAWEDLVARYPKSVYADEGRGRLAKP